MIWLVLLVLVLATVIAVLLKDRQPPPSEIDPEEAVKAAVELHAISRRLDVAWDKSEQRRGSAQLRRELSGALDEFED